MRGKGCPGFNRRFGTRIKVINTMDNQNAHNHQSTYAEFLHLLKLLDQAIEQQVQEIIDELEGIYQEDQAGIMKTDDKNGPQICQKMNN